MSWWSKKVKKPLGRIGGYIGAGVLAGLGAFTGGATLPAALALGGAAAAGAGAQGEIAYKGQKAAEEAADEQKRANDEQRAIAEAKGGEQVVDNTAETLSETEKNRKRRGYLSTLASRNTNTLLGASSYGYGGGKTRLGD
ncbi:MAG: hypothetical protein ACI4Q7_01860 [Candidatus Avelusimicrobium sp.]